MNNQVVCPECNSKEFEVYEFDNMVMMCCSHKDLDADTGSMYAMTVNKNERVGEKYE
jgi:hypothetical protein